MSLSDDVKAALQANSELLALLTGGIHNDIEEITRQSAPSAFDPETKEILPSALVKYGTEIPLRSGFGNAVQTPLTIYFYQRSGYTVIDSAMDLAYNILNESQFGSNVWKIEFDSAVRQQRDQALDCPLGTLRFVAKRLK